MNPFILAFAVAGLCLASSIGALAQTTGTLEGRVTDQQGGALVGAIVTATSSADSSSSEVVTDATGNYRLSLPPAVYTVRFSISGFQAVEESLDLAPGGVIVLGARLGGLNVRRLPRPIHFVRESQRRAEYFAEAL